MSLPSGLRPALHFECQTLVPSAPFNNSHRFGSISCAFSFRPLCFPWFTRQVRKAPRAEPREATSLLLFFVSFLGASFRLSVLKAKGRFWFSALRRCVSVGWCGFRELRAVAVACGWFGRRCRLACVDLSLVGEAGDEATLFWREDSGAAAFQEGPLSRWKAAPSLL